MKKSLYSLAFAAVFALALAPANAAFMVSPYPVPDLWGDLTANIMTGNGSTNYAYSTEDSSIVVDNYDYADVDNDVYTYSTTGENDVNGNSGNVTLVTGDATAVSTVSNDVNYIETDVVDFNPCGCEDYEMLLTGNGLTGKNSYNYANALRSKKILVKNVKEAYVDNYVDTDADTGSNDVSDNGGYYYEEHDSSWYKKTTTHRPYFYHPYLRRPPVHPPVVTVEKKGGSTYDEVSFPMGGDVTVVTGDAASATQVVNVVNTDITRVTRGTFPFAK